MTTQMIEKRLKNEEIISLKKSIKACKKEAKRFIEIDCFFIASQKLQMLLAYQNRLEELIYG
tara:strand:- start:274 stop:459 length:186 start_codon:yes stop_codon:yes gene_type:complete